MREWDSFPGTRLRVLRSFLRGTSLTRQEVARQIRQSLPAAAAHIDALVAVGLLRLAGQRPSSGGRPADEYEINHPSLSSIGVELHPDHILGLCCSINGEVWDSVRHDIDIANVQSGDYLESAIVETVNGLYRTWNDTHTIQGAGIAVPGIVNCDSKLLVNAPNLFLKNYSFQGLSRKLPVPVFVDNEANAAAVGEYWSSSVPPAASMVLISIREGVGAGIMLGGQLVRGPGWRAGEFGHMAIRAGTRPCNCGRTGCWEQYVSDRALAGELGIRDTGMLNELLAQPGPDVMRVWHAYIESLAIGIENIAACINPELVVVSGSVARLEDRLIEPLQEVLAEVSFLTQGIRVSVSRHPDNASALGAGFLAFSGLVPGLGLHTEKKGESHVE